MTMLDEALALAARGWPVFPCNPRAEKPWAKRPLIDADKDAEGKSIEGTGWIKKASCDPDVIRVWWRRWPNALIGMSPGRAGGYVVDLDPKGESVAEVEQRLVEAIGQALPAGPRTITQSGGRHVWFARPAGEHFGNHPTGLKNIDIRCDAGYVIMPPSVMVNGNAYRWEGDAFTGAAPEVPTALLELIASRRHKASSAAAPRRAVGPGSGPAAALSSGRPGEDAKRRYARAALDRIVGDLASEPAGGRGKALYSAAAQIGRFVAAGAISEREALAALEDAADANGLVRDDGPQRVAREIARGLDAGRADASDVIAKLDDIAREHVDRQQRRIAPPPPDDLPPLDAYDYPATPQPPSPETEVSTTDGEDEGCEAPSELGGGVGGDVEALLQAVRECAGLDHSDTDNGRRLRHHFGADMRVFQTRGERNAAYVVWVGTHWDRDGGIDRAHALSQRIGGLIALEADHLAATPYEARAIAEGETAAVALDALDKRRTDWSDDDKATAKRLTLQVAAGDAAAAAIKARQVARRKFGVSSKNLARLNAMRDCAAPFLLVPPEGWNHDPLVVATRTHTLRFSREIDPECPDPEVTRRRGRVVAVEGHRREDMITALVDLPYDPAAACPRWRGFLDRFLPTPVVRRFVQVMCGLGLLGETVQMLVFHYGEGANGKSVFLQTVANVLGHLASTLSPDAITGANQRQGNQASPELARLYGKRFVRISELPEGVPLQEELIKRLTGGEDIPVRDLFKGTFDFHPVFIGQMSGNGYPRVDGTNNGIWRRLKVVKWPVTLGEDEQRPFDEVVASFRPEYPGILNWLIEGALIYLDEGVETPAEVRMATQEYRDEMDPLEGFCAACVRAEADGTITAREFFEAYVAWAEANGITPIKETRFGKLMPKRWPRGDERIRLYHGCRLVDVPPRQPRNPDGERRGW